MSRFGFVLTLCMITFFSGSLSAKTIVFPPPPEFPLCNHSTGTSRNNFFPNLRFVLTPLFISSNSAFSLLGEVGIHNYRVNGTLACIPTAQHRFKISVEYLNQRMRYHYSTGEKKLCVYQFATGGKYQYWLEDAGLWHGIELGATYSSAPSHTFHRHVCRDTDQNIFRHVAGAWSAGGSLGVSLNPFDCGNLTLCVNYDHVTYRRDFPDKKTVSGVGGSFEWQQQLFSPVTFNLKGQFLRPYNYIEAALKWVSTLDGGDLSMGIYGGHTMGKDKLPSSTSVGVSLGYTFGVQDFSVIGTSYFPCYGACAPCEMVAWVTTPAVYMPEVLAIADEMRNCPRPTGNTIPPQTEIAGPYFFDASTFFTAPQGGGVGLTFSATGLPPDASISPQGFITGNNPGTSLQTFNVTVTATDKCGSTSQTFKLTYTTCL